MGGGGWGDMVDPQLFTSCVVRGELSCEGNVLWTQLLNYKITNVSFMNVSFKKEISYTLNSQPK